MRIYIVRHGECTDRDGVYIGSGTDLGLNSLGRTQIKEISLALKKKILGPVSLYTSSLKRARESAEIIKDTLDLKKCLKDSALNEIDFGLWEGLTYNEIMKKWKDIATIWYNNPFDITPPGAESFRSFYIRVEDFYNRLLESGDKNAVIVAHGGVIQLLLTLLNGDKIENRWNYNLERGSYISMIKVIS